ncbi:hypothetical protein ABK040_008959 [Willaertia magna]
MQNQVRENTPKTSVITSTKYDFDSFFLTFDIINDEKSISILKEENYEFFVSSPIINNQHEFNHYLENYCIYTVKKDKLEFAFNLMDKTDTVVIYKPSNFYLLAVFIKKSKLTISNQKDNNKKEDSEDEEKKRKRQNNNSKLTEIESTDKKRKKESSSSNNQSQQTQMKNNNFLMKLLSKHNVLILPSFIIYKTKKYSEEGNIKLFLYCDSLFDNDKKSFTKVGWFSNHLKKENTIVMNILKQYFKNRTNSYLCNIFVYENKHFKMEEIKTLFKEEEK